MNSNIKNKRSQLVGGASSAIIASMLIAVPASAQVSAPSITVDDVDYTSQVVANVVGGDADPQVNTAEITANGSANATITNDGVTTGTLENNSNTLDATSIANRNGVDASLATIDSSIGNDDGLAISAVSISDETRVTAEAGGNAGVDATDFSSGAVDVISNSIAAAVVINEGSGEYAITVGGSEPNGYTTLATENANVIADLSGSAAELVASTGVIQASSVQLSGSDTSSQFAGSSFATIGATLDTTEGTDGEVTAAVTVDGNAVTADFTGNARDASITLAADDANTSVTAAVTNVQRNDAVDSLFDNAYVFGASIGADVDSSNNPGSDLLTLRDGSVSLSSNELAATAAGNTATTSISLADGLAYDGAAANSATATIDGLLVDVKLADVSAAAGLVGVSTQLTEDGSIISNVSGSDITAVVQGTIGSNVTVAENRMVSSASGNDLTASIESGDNSATFDGSAALASRQELQSADVTANLGFTNTIEAQVGYDYGATFLGSTVTVDQNIQAASATGNTSRQSIDLAATSLNAADDTGVLLEADLSPSGDASLANADGAIVIANAMFNTGSDVTADVNDAKIYLDAGDSDMGESYNTASAITDNIQQAFATGSDAGNSISLTGVDVGAAAGIVNVQSNDLDSDVSASMTGEIELYNDNNIESASAEVSGNAQSAVARGVVASNTLSVDAQTVDVDVLADNTSNTQPAAGTVSADYVAYGIINAQEVDGDVTAVSDPDNIMVNLQLSNDAYDSSLALENNSVVAQAQGAVATNSATLDIGSLTSSDTFGEGEGYASVNNLQDLGDISVYADASGEGSEVMRTELSDAFTSSISTSSNRVAAIAEGSRANNSLSITTTEVAGNPDSGNSDVYDGSNDIDATFALANTQYSDIGSITAELRDFEGGSFLDSAAIVTDLSNSVDHSSVVTDNNLLQALASSNKATNTLSLDTVTLTDASSGLANLQVSSKDVSALIGYEGGDGVAPFSVTGIVTTGVWEGSVSALTPAQLAAFQAAYSGQPNYAYDSGTGIITFDSVGDGSLTLPVGGSSGTYNSGGVMTFVDGNIISGTITVDGNAVQGSAIGNSANNQMAVTATSIEGDDGFASTEVWTDETGNPEATADGDSSLASLQQLFGVTNESRVYTTFGIDGGLDDTISNSSLSVSDNSAYSESIGNTVANSLSVAGTDMDNGPTSGALGSSQDSGTSTITAFSDMEVVSNAVSSGSTVDVDGNTNNALAVSNNASNTLTASSTNSASSGQATADSAVAVGDNALGDASFALNNAQAAYGSLTADARTSVTNVEAIDTETTGIVDGSVSMSSNVTRAEATVNRAANTLSVGADADLGSTAALVNQQYSNADAQALASSNIALAVHGDATDPVQTVRGSSAAVEGNMTIALARGNSTSNMLNYTSGSTYSAQQTNATLSGASSSAVGDAALFNDQQNAGLVSAVATASNRIVLNSQNAPTAAGVLNGTVSNSNNTVAAYAYGNSASNTVMLSALNTGMANVAVGNQQLNTGNVTAGANVTFAISSNGLVTASSMQNSGNAASATAIGNSSVTIIGAE